MFSYDRNKCFTLNLYHYYDKNGTWAYILPQVVISETNLTHTQIPLNQTVIRMEKFLRYLLEISTLIAVRSTYTLKSVINQVWAAYNFNGNIVFKTYVDLFCV